MNYEKIKSSITWTTSTTTRQSLVTDVELDTGALPPIGLIPNYTPRSSAILQRLQLQHSWFTLERTNITLCYGLMGVKFYTRYWLYDEDHDLFIIGPSLYTDKDGSPVREMDTFVLFLYSRKLHKLECLIKHNDEKAQSAHLWLVGFNRIAPDRPGVRANVRSFYNNVCRRGSLVIPHERTSTSQILTAHGRDNSEPSHVFRAGGSMQLLTVPTYTPNLVFCQTQGSNLGLFCLVERVQVFSFIVVHHFNLPLDYQTTQATAEDRAALSFLRKSARSTARTAREMQVIKLYDATTTEDRVVFHWFEVSVALDSTIYLMISPTRYLVVRDKNQTATAAVLELPKRPRRRSEPTTHRTLIDV